MNYMRPGFEDKYGIQQLQDKILEIAVYIDEFCQKHNIDYCLMGGSALGAKRHQGFIPWDDDLDIFMTPDNYEKFRDRFQEEGEKEKFYLQEYGKQKNGMVTVPKLRMNETLYEEDLTKDWDIHKGIFVDIFILHNCPNNKLAQAWQYFWAKCVVVKGLSMRRYKGKSLAQKLMVAFAKMMPKWLALGFGLKQVYRYRNKKTKYICNFLGKTSLKRDVYRKEWFEKTEHVPFETVQLKVCAGLHEFLSNSFGNYMIPPDEESIRRAQHVGNWSTTVGCNGKGKYKDEQNLI